MWVLFSLLVEGVKKLGIFIFDVFKKLLGGFAGWIILIY